MTDMDANLNHPDLKPRKALDTSTLKAFSDEFRVELLPEYTSHWGLLHPSERTNRYNRMRGLINQMRLDWPLKQERLSALDHRYEAAIKEWNDGGGRARRDEIDRELRIQKLKDRVADAQTGRPVTKLRDLGWRERMDGIYDLLEQILADDDNDKVAHEDLQDLARRFTSFAGSAKQRADRVARNKGRVALAEEKRRIRALEEELAARDAELEALKKAKS